ncbi:MAG: hypothetical protein PHG65_01525, partial [Kiritimatiellae bacterium]|nr:hypothetical protein [Kiritimatiellia bacterium]
RLCDGHFLNKSAIFKSKYNESDRTSLFPLAQSIPLAYKTNKFRSSWILVGFVCVWKMGITKENGGQYYESNMVWSDCRSVCMCNERQR